MSRFTELFQPQPQLEEKKESVIEKSTDVPTQPKYKKPTQNKKK